MRGLIAARRMGVGDRYLETVLAAMWEQGEKMDDPEVVRRVLDAAGLDGAALIAATQDPDVKAELVANTEAAVARGVFGIPTFFVEERDVLRQGSPGPGRRGGRLMSEAPAAVGRVRHERHGHILKVIIDNPAKKNAFSPEMMAELAEAFTLLDRDPDLWVGVLCAVGENFTPVSTCRSSSGRGPGRPRSPTTTSTRSACATAAASPSSPPCRASPSRSASRWPWPATSSSPPTTAASARWRPNAASRPWAARTSAM
jgi:hypothetical protein